MSKEGIIQIICAGVVSKTVENRLSDTSLRQDALNEAIKAKAGINLSQEEMEKLLSIPKVNNIKEFSKECINSGVLGDIKKI